MVNVLAFDCSTGACSAAVLAGERVLARRTAVMTRGQAEALLPMLAGVLAEAGLGWGDLGLLGVTVGPGSFTGLRIGLAAARGLALAGALPLAGVTTTEVVAAAVPAAERFGEDSGAGGERPVLACIDGKRADLFVQAFTADLTPLGEPEALLPEEAAWRYPDPLLLAGDGAARLAAAMPWAVLSTADPFPDPCLIARLAVRRQAEDRALPPHPLYLRPPDVTLPAGTVPPLAEAAP